MVWYGSNGGVDDKIESGIVSYHSEMEHVFDIWTSNIKIHQI